MGLSSFLRTAGRGAASVGRAVQVASRKLDEVVAGQPPVQQTQPSAPAPQAAPIDPAAASNVPATQPPSEAAPQGTASSTAIPRTFSLPDIGPPPDPADPKYAGEEGRKLHAAEMEQYQHKQDIHQAYQDLDRIYNEAHPGRDFRKEYDEYVAMQKQHEKSRPQGSRLARFALALGDQNPAVESSNLARYDREVEQAQGRSDESFSKRLALRMQMHEKTAAEAEAQGNFRKALAEREKMALLKADEDVIKHKQDMEKVTAQQEGANERAGIRAEAMQRTAQIRAAAIARTHGLTGTFLETFQKRVANAVGSLFGPRDLTKDYSPADVDSLTNYIESIAEMIHDQQYGDGSADTWVKTPPGKRAKPKEETTPKAKPTF